MKVDELESAQIRSRQGGCDEAPDLKQLAQCYDRRYSRDYCRKHQGRHYGQLRTLLRCVPALGACTRVLDYGCGSARRPEDAVIHPGAL